MTSKNSDCLNRAIKLLALRPHSVRELETKLATKGFPEGEIANAVEWLSQRGYLNDGEFGIIYAKARVARARVGSARLKMDLQAKGLDGDVVDCALGHVYGSDGAELAVALDAAARKAGSLAPGTGTEAARKKIFDHLVRKGFSAELARLVVFEKFRDIMAGKIIRDDA
jgi:regulatory protein